MVFLETERLYLREMTENDFESLNKVFADSDIMRHYPYTFDENMVRNWIERNIERYRIFGFGLWAVCLKETGEMIGDSGEYLRATFNYKPADASTVTVTQTDAFTYYFNIESIIPLFI